MFAQLPSHTEDKDTNKRTNMWTKTAKKFRRSKAAADNANADICKNNSLPDVDAEGVAILGKSLSADDASTMMVEEIDAHPDVCKNNSSSTESQMTMSQGPSTSCEEGEVIALVTSSVSDEFASDVERDDGQRNVEDTNSAGEVVVDAVSNKDTSDEDTSCVNSASEVSAQPDENIQAENIAKCTRLCQGLENMMHERVNSINQIKKVLKNEIKLDSGKSPNF